MNSILIFLIIVTVIHVITAILGLRDLFSRPGLHPVGKWIAAALIAFIYVTGPLLYFMYGRAEKSWVNKIRVVQQQTAASESADNDRDNHKHTG